jgi:precorrin-3B methylase
MSKKNKMKNLIIHSSDSQDDKIESAVSNYHQMEEIVRKINYTALKDFEIVIDSKFSVNSQEYITRGVNALFKQRKDTAVAFLCSEPENKEAILFHFKEINKSISQMLGL